MEAELILPYRTDWREMSRILEYCKGKGADRSTLDARFGGGESLRETLNALEQLALIERDDTGDVRLTPFGDRLAYAPNESERRLILIEAMLGRDQNLCRLVTIGRKRGCSGDDVHPCTTGRELQPLDDAGRPLVDPRDDGPGLGKIGVG